MKLKPSIILTAIIATVGWRVLAQTKPLATASSFRCVNGTLYDTDASKLWHRINGDFKFKKNGVVVVTTFSIYQYTWEEYGGPPGMEPGRPGSRVDYGPPLAITNLPDYKSLAAGSTIYCRLTRVGTYDDGKNPTLALWDYGTKPTQDALRKLKDDADEQQKAAEKELDERRRAAAKVIAAKKQTEDARVIHWLLSQATNGSESAQYSLGLRYLKGEGVPKDEKQSREWLGKAAAQGSEEAAVALSKLNQVSADSPTTR